MVSPPPKVIKITEQQLVQQILGYLNFKGCYCWRNNTGRIFAGDDGKKRMIKFGIVGSSDIIGITPQGKFLAVECKVGRNKPTIFQEAFLDEVRRRGGIPILAYSLDDVENLLKDII